jgi:DNA invertase Pin-like site-specific DNA recombinase
MKTAYSYVRFSSRKQAKGDSLERQEEMAEAWCKENGYRLDDSLKPDKGISGFKGRNASKGNLAFFLREIEDGLIPKGSVLIIESPDRLSREPLDQATELFKGILRAGLTIVTLTPRYEFRPEDVNDLGKRVLLDSLAYRAHEESKTKGERVAKAKARNRERLAEQKMTAKGPAWVKLSADRKSWKLIPEKVAVVRKVFRLAAEGYGVQRLARKLSEAGVPSLTGIPWSRSGLAFLLGSKSVLGEFQPCVGYGSKSDRHPVGEPIQGYYPPVIDEDLFYRVQAEFAKRAFGRPKKNEAGLKGQHCNGNVGEGVSNLFTGICIDARNGSRFTVTYGGFGKRFVSYGSLMKRKGTDYASLPYEVFETVFLTWTKELRAKDVLPESGSEQLEESVFAKEARLAEINDKIAKVKAKILGTGDVETLSDLLVTLDKEKKSTEAALERLRAELHSSKDFSLEETQELIELLAATKGSAHGELRQRLKSRIQRLISEIRILINKEGMKRTALVQVFFEGGKRRSFALHCVPIRKNQKSEPLIDLKTQEPFMGGFQVHFDMDGQIMTAGRFPRRWLVVVTGEKELDGRNLLKCDLRNGDDVRRVIEALAS